MLPKEPIESFWDGLWLGIQPFLYLISDNQFLKSNLLPNEPIESFWGALWLGILPFLYFISEKPIFSN